MKYNIPTKAVIGKLEKVLEKEVALFKPKKILLITGGQAMRKAGVIKKISDYLSSYQLSLFEDVKPNPSPETVEIAKQETDLVIGLGGGSVLDVAKKLATDLKRPCIAIPTTAGTGSEVTPFAALYDWEKKKKISEIVDFPKVAIVDYRLTLTMPSHLVASTGIDALSQAIEAFWSKHSVSESDEHAIKAIELVMLNLRKSFEGDAKAREAMAIAALEAGRAFGHTKTTAVHAASYPLSIHYLISHGAACGLTLPHFLVYNSQVLENDCLDERGVDFVKTRIREIVRILGAKDVFEAKDILLNLMKSVDLPTEADIDVDTVLKDAFAPERVANNPRLVTEDGLREILEIIKKKSPEEGEGFC